MQWPDCLVDRALTDQELITALSRYLSVEPQTILIVSEVPSTRIPPTTTMLCERRRTQGDFILKLSFYPQNEEIAASDGFQFIEFLSATKACRCLIPDTSENPYAMILVDGINRRRRVFLEVERMNLEPEEYVIARKQ